MGLFNKIFSINKDKQSDKKSFTDVEIKNSYFGNGIFTVYRLV